jgi:hypothetical protein
MKCKSQPTQGFLLQPTPLNAVKKKKKENKPSPHSFHDDIYTETQFAKAGRARRKQTCMNCNQTNRRQRKEIPQFPLVASKLRAQPGSPVVPLSCCPVVSPLPLSSACGRLRKATEGYGQFILFYFPKIA